MRIKLNNSKEFFDEILKKENMSLRDLSGKIKANYSNLKQYRRGEKTIPESIFNKILELSIKKSYWLGNIERINENWGAIKGGKIAAQNDKGNKRITYARKFVNIKKVKIKLNEFFCEFYGAILGDGCISKFKDLEDKERYLIYISGNKNLDSTYFKYLKKQILQEFGLNAYYYNYKNKNVCTLAIKNKGFALQLVKNYGFPLGLKYGNLKIPNKLLNLKWKLKKYVIRGLVDTDGSIYAKKNEGYRYPIISISSKDEKFLKGVSEILRSNGYPSYISSHNVCVRGSDNIKRWFVDIGSSNSRNIKKYEYFIKNKKLPPMILGS